VKITTEVCVTQINEQRPGKWKRISKRGNAAVGIIREFQAKDVPGVTAVVAETNGQIATIRFEEAKPIQQKHEMYFVLDESDDARYRDIPIFTIVPKKFWERHHHLDDQIGEHNINLPDGFYEVTEAEFEYDGGSAEEGRRKLIEAGFIPMPPPGLAAMVLGATNDDYSEDEVFEDNEGDGNNEGEEDD
jgi:hypothetical protein